MYAGSFGYSVLIIVSVSCMAIISARSMFWSPCSLLEMLTASMANNVACVQRKGKCAIQ